ncbi:hypothetical protein CL657_02280 [bacterium]|nr:hypothetical protein [bacterium]
MLKKYIQKKIGLPLICVTLSYLCVSCGLTSKTDSPATLVDLTIEGNFKKAIIAINTATDNTSNRENLGLLPSEPETTNLTISPLNHQMFHTPLLTPSKSSLNPKTPLLQLNKLEENPDVIEFYDPYQEKNIHATKLQENPSCIVYVETDSKDDLEALNNFNYNLNSAMAYFESSVSKNAIELLGPELGIPIDFEKNNKTILFITTIKNKDGEEQPNMAGFHWAGNLSVSNELSNQRKLIYINKPFIINGSYQAVIAREYVHLLVTSYALKHGKNIIFETWLSEGIADGLAVFLANRANLVSDRYTYLNYSTLVKGSGPFFSAPDITRFEHYITGYTFLDYCRIQMELGSNFYKDLIEMMVQNNTSNHNQLNELIKMNNEQNDPEQILEFQDALISYRIANHVKHPSNKYGYKGQAITDLIPFMKTPTENNLSIEPGGAIYLIQGNFSTTDIEEFSPEEHGPNIKFYRISPEEQ